jgi:hypothetical protein
MLSNNVSMFLLSKGNFPIVIMNLKQTVKKGSHALTNRIDLQYDTRGPNIDLKYIVIIVLVLLFGFFFFWFYICILNATWWAVLVRISCTRSRRVDIVRARVASTTIRVGTKTVNLLFFRTERSRGWGLTFGWSRALISSSADFANIMRTIQRWFDWRASDCFRRLECLFDVSVN